MKKLFLNYIKEGLLIPGYRAKFKSKTLLIGDINLEFSEAGHCMHEYYDQEVLDYYEDISKEEIDNIKDWNKVEFEALNNNDPYTLNELWWPLSGREKTLYYRNVSGYVFLLEDGQRLLVGDTNVLGGWCDYKTDIQGLIVKGMKRIR